MARRLNTQFLTILLLVVVGIGVAIGLAEKFLIHEHPDHYIALGSQAMKDHNWQEAVLDFSKAARLDPKNPKIELMLAQAVGNTIQTDPDAIRLELGAYQQALEIDPKCLPALAALSDFYTHRAEQGFDASDFTSAIRYSRQAHDADPTDETMLTRADEMVIQQWINGFDANQSDLDQAVKDLKALWKKNPTDAELPFNLARAEMEQGMRIARQNDTRYQLTEVTDHYRNAVAIFESVLASSAASQPSGAAGSTSGPVIPGIASQEKNPGMHYAFARVLAQLADLDESTPNISKQDQDRAAAEIGRARALSTPADKTYVDINEFAAQMAMRRGDVDGAVAIYRAMPDSLERDMALAEVFSRSPKTQPDGVKMLKTAIGSLVDDPNHIQFYSARFLLMMELTKIQVYQYVVMPDSPQKTQLHEEIRSTLDKLDQVAGVRVSYPLKDVEARFQIFSGGEDEMAGVQKLARVMSDNPPPKKDSYWYNLQTLLAKGYEDTNQTSNAVVIMRDVVQQYPKDVESLKHLIGLLLQEHPDEAAPHIDDLQKLAPKDPVLNIYLIQLRLSDPDKYNAQIQEFYSKLKEDSPQRMSAKARVALQILQSLMSAPPKDKDTDKEKRDTEETYFRDDAERLLRLCTAQNPTSPADWIRLSELLLTEKKTNEALDVATKGLAANPGDQRLRILIPQIKGESQTAIEDLEMQMLKEDPDKAHGELGLARMAAAKGDVDGEALHLKLAEKASPNNVDVENALFTYYLTHRQFDQATACIPLLARLDADHASGELYRLSLAEAQGDHATAEGIARRLTQDKPEFARSWLALGEVLKDEEQYQQAIPQYRVSLDKESTLVEAYVGLAQCFYGLHRPDDAMHVIDDGLTRMPNNEMLRQLKLTYQLNSGQPEDALADLEREISQRPSPDLFAALANVVIRYCGKLHQNHEDDKATAQAEAGIAALKKPIDVLAQWPDESELYVAMSQLQLMAGHTQEALNTLVAWSNRDKWKSQPAPYLALSEFYEEIGIRDRAEDAMHTALQESGYQVEYQIRMANLLSMHQKYDEALHLLHGVNKDNPQVREAIVPILIVAGRFDEAQAEVKADLASNPPDAEKLLQTWALALFEHGKYQDAVDRATDALALSPHDQTVLFCRARARLALRPPDANGAVQDLEVVRQGSPNLAEVRIYLANAHLILNQPEEAAGEIQAGLRLVPNDKPLRMKLVDIYTNGPHPRLSEALKTLQDVETVKPFDTDPDIFQYEAMIYSREHDNDNALAKSEVAMKLAPANPVIVRTNFQILADSKNYQAVVDHYAAIDPKLKTTSWALWDLSLAEKQLNNDQALPDMNKALLAAEKEDDPVELDNIAQSINQNFTYDDAVNALIPLAKESVSAKISLARIYQAHGDDPAALATIDELMSGADKLKPRDQINLYTQAALMYQLAKPNPMPDKAYTAYQDWLKIEPNNMEALNNLACLLADNFPPDRAQEGLKYADQAVGEMGNLGRTEPRLLDTQAWLQILTGSPDEGIHTLNTIMDGFGPFPEEYLHIGEGYLRLGMPDPIQAEAQAKLGLQMVIKRHSGDSDAALRAKFQDLINRSEAMRKAKPQQAQVP